MKKNETEAQRVVLEELFNDLYRNRVRIYKVNFVRGILFGAGSALGGTIVIALIPIRQIQRCLPGRSHRR